MSNEHNRAGAIPLSHTRAADRNTSASGTSRTIRTIRTTGRVTITNAYLQDRDQAWARGPNHAMSYMSYLSYRSYPAPSTRAVACVCVSVPHPPVCGGVSLQTPGHRAEAPIRSRRRREARRVRLNPRRGVAERGASAPPRTAGTARTAAPPSADRDIPARPGRRRRG